MPPTTEAIRALMASSGARFMRVDAVKKDGSIGRFVFNRSLNAARVEGADTEGGAMAAETRRANNPDLINVWCSMRQRWSSFDATQVVATKARGIVQDWTPAVRAAPAPRPATRRTAAAELMATA
jgi:hypothetical protein